MGCAQHKDAAEPVRRPRLPLPRKAVRPSTSSTSSSSSLRSSTSQIWDDEKFDQQMRRRSDRISVQKSGCLKGARGGDTSPRSPCSVRISKLTPERWEPLDTASTAYSDDSRLSSEWSIDSDEGSLGPWPSLIACDSLDSAESDYSIDLEEKIVIKSLRNVSARIHS